MLLPILELIVDPLPHAAALNMAIDEVLLKQARRPALRLYRWNEPSVSFGCFGSHAKALAMSGGRPVVRRWTGGGIVEHGADTTYSLFVPATESGFFEFSPAASYQEIHAALAAAMAESGVPAEMAAEPVTPGSSACFESPVRHDVISAGKKVAGAAQRRTRWGMLHQGSIQPPLPPEFAERFASRLAPRIMRREIGPAVLAEAGEIAAQKYGTDAWTRRH